MKNIILLFAIIYSIVSSCKVKKNTETAEANTAVKETSAPEKTTGKVSHQFRSTGCVTVIMVETKDTTNPLILIPKEALPNAFDVNGLKVSFNYHSLRMPQPPGCNKGIPAEITNLEKR